MLDRLFSQKTFHSLEKIIRITQQRHEVVSSNIANIETPGYKAKDIDFKAALAGASGAGQGFKLVRTDAQHIGPEMNSASQIEPFADPGEWNGYNWVNIDNEMTKLTENNLMYRAGVEALLRKLAILKTVIQEGGR